MKNMETSVLIIGGGFSGAATAIQLAARGIGSTIVESRGQVARGAAYSTHADEHLLNVPAGKMGLFAGAASGFAEHVESDGIAHQDFVSRRRFGDYVAGELARAVEKGGVEVVRDRAIAARRVGERWHVTLDSGREVVGRALVLANGNQPPAPVPIEGLVDERRIDDPWSEAGRARIAALADEGGDVLLLGTGLTMVDVVLTLDRLGFRGHVTALSRRGQVPRSHAPHAEAASVALDEVPLPLSQALRWMRRRGREDWRSAVDGLRPVTQALWKRLDLESRRRFLRHLKPWWDVHRHRIAPAAAAVIGRMIAEERLSIVAGRARLAVESDDGARIEIARRGGGSGVVEAATVINCTGPLARIDEADDPLLRQMIAERWVEVDPMGLGLMVGDDDRLAGTVDAWAVGPMTKGRHWEVTAVPDIRVHVERIADDVARKIAAIA